MPPFLRQLALRLRAIFRRSALDADMRAEMDAHLEQATERLVRRGMTLEDARLAARREFGNVAVLQEDGRDVRGMRWIESLTGDVRFALRHFSRRPLFAVTIVLVLSLGIGAHAAVFSMLQAYTTRPAPGVPRDAALVHVRAKERIQSDTRWLPRAISYPEWQEIAALRETFSAVAGWTTHDGAVAASAHDEPANARFHFVTDDYFSTVGVSIALGPGLPASRSGVDAPELVAVISDAFWRTAFGGRRDVLGKTIRVNDVPVRVVGVAARRFNGVLQTNGTRILWMPLSARARVVRSTALALSSRDTALLHVVARLELGISAKRATVAVQLVAARAVAQMKPSRAVTARDADVVPLRGDTQLPTNGDAAMIATVFGSMALLVLLVACTNVSALVVGASIARRQEIAIRLSLGASRGRVIRQLLTESTLLAIAGGAFGLMLYAWITRLVASRVPEVELAPDLGTVAFTIVIALGIGILFGLSPALHATRVGVADALKDSGGGATKRSRLQRTFVVAQIVLTQPLLVGLGMLVAIVAGDVANSRPPGIDERVIVLRLNFFAGVGSFADKRAALDRLLQRVTQLPGVVGVVSDAYGYRNTTLSVHPDDRGTLDRSAEPVAVHMEATRPGYFKLLDVPIVRGRELAPSDRRDDAVVIGEDLARALWGSADPIGRRFTQASTETGLDKDLTVVGVYDTRYATTRGQGVRIFAASDGRLDDAFLIRTNGPAEHMLAAIRALVRDEVPGNPAWVVTLAQQEDRRRVEALQVSGGASAGGVLALLLASIGLYGVVALAVGQRRREIGIRLALGARAEQVVTMLFANGLRLSAIGLLLGLPLSVVALRLLASEVRLPATSMPAIGGGIALVVLLVACIATWVPARRAATIDPVTALRTD